MFLPGLSMVRELMEVVGDVVAIYDRMGFIDYPRCVFAGLAGTVDGKPGMDLLSEKRGNFHQNGERFSGHAIDVRTGEKAHDGGQARGEAEKRGSGRPSFHGGRRALTTENEILLPRLHCVQL